MTGWQTLGRLVWAEAKGPVLIYHWKRSFPRGRRVRRYICRATSGGYCRGLMRIGFCFFSYESLVSTSAQALAKNLGCLMTRCVLSYRAVH